MPPMPIFEIIAFAALAVFALVTFVVLMKYGGPGHR
jgi:hypothetical protein